MHSKEGLKSISWYNIIVLSRGDIMRIEKNQKSTDTVRYISFIFTYKICSQEKLNFQHHYINSLKGGNEWYRSYQN